MSQAAIGYAKTNGQDDCSSVMPLRLRYPMAVSFAVHAAVAIYIFSGTGPRGNDLPLGAQTMSATFIELEAPPAPVPAVAAAPTPVPPQKISMPVVAEMKRAEAPRVVPAKTATAILTSEPTPSHRTQQTAAASATPANYGTPSPSPDPGDTVGTTSDSAPLFVTQAHFRGPPTPARYPKRARDLNQEGEVLLHVRLDNLGNAEEIVVWRSSGFILLDNAALAAARRWQFEPERRNGRPVFARVQIPVRFALN
ncbi:MAG: TonB family protein [Parvibaculum sp.]|nr:TonB family protein [Parvibaculum sp.]